MRKFIALAVLCALITAPAMADLKPTPSLAQGRLTPTGEGTVGVYAPDTGYGAGIFTNFKVNAEASDIISATFAFHWPYVTTVYIGYVGTRLIYDNAELEVIGANAAGPFSIGTCHTTGSSPTPCWGVGAFPNYSSGTWQIGTLYNDVPGYWTNTYIMAGSSIVPFLQVTFHVKDVIPDSYLDAFAMAAPVFRFSAASTGAWWTGFAGAVNSPAYGFGIIPEPASLSLLGAGLALVGAGVWRRRR